MLNHKGTKTIATPRLLLRPFIVEDAHDMYANWASDPRVTKYLTWMPHESPEATAELLALWVPNYENPAYYNWVITLEGRAIGNVSIVRQSDKSEYMEFGYCLSASYWNQGIMPEAVSAVRDFLFREVGAHRLVIRHAAKNPGSGKVARKCGFTWDGRQRQEFRSAWGEYLDIEAYSLLRNEWEEMQKDTVSAKLTLDTPRLILRPANIGDFEAVHAYAGCPENTKYMSWGPNDEKMTREYLLHCEKAWAQEKITDHEFVMVQKETGKVIGGCGLFLDEDGRQATLGWILHRDYWKQGYTPEAAQAMVDYAFGVLGIHRVYSTCDGENYGSYRVMEKIGMRREAEFKQARDCRGEWHDEYKYGLLKEEWEKIANN